MPGGDRAQPAPAGTKSARRERNENQTGTSGNFRELSGTFGNFRELSGTFGNFGEVPGTFGNFRELSGTCLAFPVTFRELPNSTGTSGNATGTSRELPGTGSANLFGALRTRLAQFGALRNLMLADVNARRTVGAARMSAGASVAFRRGIFVACTGALHVYPFENVCDRRRMRLSQRIQIGISEWQSCLATECGTVKGVAILVPDKDIKPGLCRDGDPAPPEGLREVRFSGHLPLCPPGLE